MKWEWLQKQSAVGKLSIFVLSIHIDKIHGNIGSMSSCKCFNEFMQLGILFDDGTIAYFEKNEGCGPVGANPEEGHEVDKRTGAYEDRLRSVGLFSLEKSGLCEDLNSSLPVSEGGLQGSQRGTLHQKLQ
ncbi:hypothetical protein DUI87_23258 [Hirundo rustica rustica]|uniref:Uncharacterized protein n=1 Tax=Hirundo rustica rustica TaxID=333673 RepID=A0A3M0JK05_HIRRU|nr:hypothetical protein DUI87_23258 [Hirundo rustica rustica]